jgi:hypothetical protein
MKTVKSIFLFSVALILTVFLFEFILSFGGIMNPIVKIDSNKGERYFPNKMCCSMFVSEGFGLAKTNLSGWFGKEFFDNGSSDISIAVLGNSFVAARQVFERDNFLSVAEKSINEKLSKSSVSLFNFGKEAMPLSELLYIKEEISAVYNPDYYLVLINPQSFAAADRLVPHYKLVEDSLCLDLSFKNSYIVKFYNKFSFLSESSVLFLAYRMKNKLPQTAKILFDKFYFTKYEPQQNNSIYYSISDLNKTIIERLAKDKKVIFLLDLDPIAYNNVKALTPKSSVIDLYSVLSKMKNEQGIDPNYWNISKVEGHWNIPAHKVIGETIAKNVINIINND